MNGSYNFENYSTKEGLSQNAVLSILQDKEGFMWFGTKDGLNRYDGYSNEVFHNDPFNPTTISPNNITALFEDSNSNFWIGTSYGELNLYKKKYQSFQQIRYNTYKASNDNAFQITAIAEDSIKNLWIGTKGDGLYKLTFSNGNTVNPKVVHFVNKPKDKNSISSNYIFAIHLDSLKNLWIGAGNDLLKVNVKENNFTRQNILINHISPTPQYEITSICQTDNAYLWLGTPDGLILFNINTRETELYPYEFRIVNHIVKDQQNKLWVATISGVIKFDPIKKTFRAFLHDPFEPLSLSYNAISSLYCDRTGIIWIGTNGEGLDIFDPYNNQFHTFIRRNDKTSRIPGFSIGAICEDDQDCVWIATSVLYCWNRKTGKLKSYETSPKQSDGFGYSGAYSIIQSKNSDIWTGSGAGLFDYNHKTGKIIEYKEFISDSIKIRQRVVYCVFQDNDGYIWAATNNYLCKLVDPVRKVFKIYLYNNDWQSEISRVNIYEDNSGKFWICSRDGLLCFDQNNGSIVRYKYNAANKSSLNNNTVRCLCPDPKEPNKFFWLGTSGGGLNKFNIDLKTFTHFTTKDGLPNNVVYGILPDEKGNLWISTNKGISKFNPESLTFRNFDIHDGLQSDEFNIGAYFKSKSGEMFFGGIKGLNYFYPQEINDNKHVPNIVITKCEILKKPDSRLDDNAVALNIYDKSKDLILPYTDNIISFNFAAMDFSSPEKNNFSYMLENFDKTWINSGTNHSALYTNLPPGNYIFHVIGSNNDGIWNKKGASLSFVIMPPWWQTWWAYLIYGLLFFSSLLFIRHYELNRLKLKTQLKLEKVESNSLRNLDKLKSRFFANISHEFRTPLTLILGQIESVMSSNIDIAEKGKLQVANRNSKRLLTLINQLLDISKIESGSMELKTEQHNIVPFLKNLFYAFELIAESKKIILKFESDYENIQVNYDPDKMEKIFNNIYSNAFKFTPERGEIKTTLSINNAFVEIKIKDTGIGIPEDRIKNIFDRFYQVDSSTTRKHEGTGIGLSLAKELIELHKGKINVSSKVSEGTEFIITFSINNTNFEAEKSVKDSSDRSSQIDNFIELEETSETQALTDPMFRYEEKIILCVEDNSDIRAYIREQMESEYKVIEASNGEEGILIAKENIPNLIISDIMMPKMNGYQFCRHIKSDEKTSHIPIIMLTAKAGLDDKIEGLETGADAYITKPFSAKELKARVKNLIYQREQLRKRFSKSTIIKPSDVSAVSVDQEYLQKVIGLIEANLGDENFNSEKLAYGVNMSLSQLNRKLNALIDQPAGQLIRSLRLQRAADLIKKNAGNITEISYMVGFNDHGYFSKLFKKQFGCSPTKFKKNNSD